MNKSDSLKSTENLLRSRTYACMWCRRRYSFTNSYFAKCIWYMPWTMTMFVAGCFFFVDALMYVCTCGNCGSLNPFLIKYEQKRETESKWNSIRTGSNYTGVWKKNPMIKLLPLFLPQKRERVSQLHLIVFWVAFFSSMPQKDWSTFWWLFQYIL